MKKGGREEGMVRGLMRLRCEIVEGKVHSAGAGV